MKIFVEYEYGLLQYPEMMEIRSGSIISWSLRGVDVRGDWIRWMIYFPEDNPFHNEQSSSFSTETIGRAGKHVGLTQALRAVETGHYKYGIRVIDMETDTILVDDDPYLIVF